jgi:hypothetical protein
VARDQMTALPASKHFLNRRAHSVDGADDPERPRRVHGAIGERLAHR